MRANKYNYMNVIQQNFGYGHGWEDVSEYEATSSGQSIEMSDKIIKDSKGRDKKETLLKHDLREYIESRTGACRVIFRKELKNKIS